MFFLENKKIWVAGHNGMVGAALLDRLAKERCEVLTVSHSELDLRDHARVRQWMGDNKPDAVILAAAKVGGIMANSQNPASFFYDNMMISSNVIHNAYEVGVKKLLFLGSSCIYPKECPQPILEDYLLGGALEPTNEAYALAKIGGLKMAAYYRSQYGCDFISAMPCNLFGEGDSYDEQKSHVIPALIMKFHKAKVTGEEKITLWGTGSPLREFLYVDDLVHGLVFMLQHYSGAQHVNIGTGHEISIKELSMLVANRIGYNGVVEFDNINPDGTPRKLLDVSKLGKMGWYPPLLDLCDDDFVRYMASGIDAAYKDFLNRAPENIL